MTRHQGFEVRLAPEVVRVIGELAQRSGKTLDDVRFIHAAQDRLKRNGTRAEGVKKLRSLDLWEIRAGRNRLFFCLLPGTRVIAVGAMVAKSSSCRSHGREVVQEDPDGATEADRATRSFVARGAGARPMRWEDLREELMAIPGYKEGFDELFPYHELALELNGLRADMDLSQTEFGRLVGVPQSTIARLESGQQGPSVRTLQRIAEATDTELVIEFRRPKRKRRTERQSTPASSASDERSTEPLAASVGDDARGGSDR